ncbi:AraC family transcriptional regulator [Massilia sp. NR 4-1]|uniref:helix-turn-helix transcriptional regulator n=1 Tax=Massilia sp. NR 4-1 TaxID=1678028 RepID=UPI00067CCAD8|nr:AraC family transcriptional regulator [Massilia sp. NR 4-1]AKU20513.1 AraC family transcriptional regulator [Massilia sp. NR 4-1]
MTSPPTTAMQFEQTRHELSTGSGVKISYIDYTPEQSCVVQSESPPCLAVCVFLEGSGESVLQNRARVRYAPDQALLFCSPDSSMSETHLPGRQHLRAVEIHYTEQTLQQIQGMPVQSMLRQLAAQASLRPAGPDSFLYQTPASSAMRAIAEQIFRQRAPAGVQQLFLHSKALELLSLLVAALLDEPALAEAPAVQRRDHKKLDHARECLLARLDHNWSLAELAHTANLNERKLKEGFKALFGTSVHAYLQEKRMQAAANLLSRTNLSITEVVMQTGYANPSHFTKLFRRHFGMTPREFIQSQTQ